MLSKTGREVICIPQGRGFLRAECQCAGNKYLIYNREMQTLCVWFFRLSLPLIVCACVYRAPGTHRVHGQLSSAPRLLSTSSILLFTLMSFSWCKVGSCSSVTHAHIYKCLHRHTSAEGRILLAGIELWSQSLPWSSICRQNKIERFEWWACFH